LTKKGILEKIQALVEIPSAGPSPSFSSPQICSALLIMGEKETVGRIQLSKKLGIGEGAIRTVMRHLTRAGIVQTTKKGCALTPKGIALHKRLRSRLSKAITIDAGELALDSASSAILVKASARKVRQGIEQRDAAIKAGATGACTVLMRNGRFVMPMGSDEWKLDHHDPLVGELNNMFHPNDNDVIIIASARERNLADYGAIAAGLTLIE